MTVELRELRWAVVVSEHRSLRQAAERLSIRQSTLSRRLHDLEHQLGAKLFERSNGGTKPTPAGLEFLDSVRRVLHETETITARFKTRSRGDSGQLTIGVHASFSTGNFRAILEEYSRRHPDVELCFVDGSSEHLFNDLEGSAIDLAFIADQSPRWSDLILPVWSERLVVAIPSDHALADHEAILWSDLRDERILVSQRGPGSEFLRLIVARLGYPMPCNVRCHDVGLDRLLSLVGLGRGLVLALEGASGAAYPGVVLREMHDGDGATRLAFRAYWRRANENPALSSFVSILRQRYPDLSAKKHPH